MLALRTRLTRTKIRFLVVVARPVPERPPTRSRKRLAAVAVGLGFVAFTVAQLVLGWAIDTERLPLRDPIYFDKLAVFRRHPAFLSGTPEFTTNKPITVLFAGSSRTLNAVDGRAASDHLTQELGRPVTAFNFGQAGAGPITNAVYVRRLMKDGVKPDFVLIEIHPVFLAGQRSEPPETRWLLPLRLRREELPVVRGMGFPAETPPAHGVRGYLAPWHEYRFLLVDRYAPFLVMNATRLNGGHTPDAYGFTRLQDRSTPADRARYLQIAWGQYADYFGEYRPNGCGVNGLRDTLEQCRAAGWRAALVLMPESSEWLGWYPEDGLCELEAVVHDLAEEYRVPVFDTRRWVADDHSLDGHHLTGPGADVYTRKIARDAIAPWVSQTLRESTGATP